MYRAFPLAAPQKSTGVRLADILFVLAAALYAWLAFRGIVLLSASGTMLDSDLQTYAQGMARAFFPENFAADPILAHRGEANSIQNLQRWLAEMLLEQENFGLALLKAGCIAIFCFYCFWYALGRHLFGSPCLAALLAVCSGITIWVGWGTFWGVTHSDPVPRVFFAAIFPLLFWLALSALARPWLRPVAMLACGCAMWVHGVSALNCGAMFFSAFFFLRPQGTGRAGHLLNLALCLVAFLVPVCIFLSPSLAQGASFSAEDLAFFREMQAFRWEKDFTDFWPRVRGAFTPPAPLFFLTIIGAMCWFAVRQARKAQFAGLVRFIPALLPGLCAVALLSWLEPLLAPDFGRLSMGHELVRGLRFLIPLAWLLIIAACGCYTGKWQRRAILAITFCALMLLNQDRQHLAVRTALEEFCGLPLSAQAQELIREAQAEKALVAAVTSVVAPGEAVFCPVDQMPLRYVGRRSVAHSFKDGYSFFYNKELEASRKWFAIETALHEEPDGLAKAWELSGAPWLLVPRGELAQVPPATRAAGPALETPAWLLFHRP
ncbi:MAG: translation initiation factor 2 [Desulfovibrio sp.]|nr:translation initiation factor 2 [Desulfovibrio sp.]